MATFGWAYIDCTDSGSAASGGGQAAGPDGSVQFVTGSNATSGSSNFLFYTSSYSSLAANTLVLSGTLIVTGTISASTFHIEDVAVNDSTSDTVISGSLQVYGNSGLDIEYFNAESILKVPGMRVNYTQVIDVAGTTGSNGDYIIGIRAGDADTDYRLPSASLAGTGSLRIIKDEQTSRSATAIYISSSSPDTIDGAASYILTGSMSAINLYSDGHNWYIF
jgi:hypothetical protein